MWFKVDDSFFSNPKTAMLSDGATALWLRSGSWSAQQLTGGFIPARMLPMFRGSDDSVQELCDAGLWERDSERDGYRFHDWNDYQPDGEEVDALRRKRSEAGKMGANRRWKRKTVDENGKNGKTDGKCHGKPMANAWQNDGKSMANSCPVPVPVPDKKEEELHSSSKESEETLTADDWAHTGNGTDTISLMRDQYTKLDMRDTLQAFTTHHGQATKPPDMWARLFQGWCDRRATIAQVPEQHRHTHTWACEHTLAVLGLTDRTQVDDETMGEACRIANQLNEKENKP